MAENGREYVEYIKTIVDGDSAFDFRDKINQMGVECNNGLNDVALARQDIVDADVRINQSIATINTAIGNFNTNYEQKLGSFNTNAVDKTGSFDSNAVSKTEDFDKHVKDNKDYIITEAITEATEQIVKNITEIPIIQVRQLQPVPDRQGFYPDFWFQIIPEGGIEPAIISSIYMYSTTEDIIVQTQGNARRKALNVNINEDEEAATQYIISTTAHYTGSSSLETEKTYLRLEIREEGGLTFTDTSFVKVSTGGFDMSFEDGYIVLKTNDTSTSWSDYVYTEYNFIAIENSGNQLDTSISQTYTFVLDLVPR